VPWLAPSSHRELLALSIHISQPIPVVPHILHPQQFCPAITCIDPLLRCLVTVITAVTARRDLATTPDWTSTSRTNYLTNLPSRRRQAVDEQFSACVTGGAKFRAITSFESATFHRSIKIKSDTGDFCFLQAYFGVDQTCGFKMSTIQQLKNFIRHGKFAPVPRCSFCRVALSGPELLLCWFLAGCGIPVFACDRGMCTSRLTRPPQENKPRLPKNLPSLQHTSSNKPRNTWQRHSRSQQWATILTQINMLQFKRLTR
jgi:hypothetical protein